MNYTSTRGSLRQVLVQTQHNTPGVARFCLENVDRWMTESTLNLEWFTSGDGLAMIFNIDLHLLKYVLYIQNTFFF